MKQVNKEVWTTLGVLSGKVKAGVEDETVKQQLLETIKHLEEALKE